MKKSPIGSYVTTWSPSDGTVVISEVWLCWRKYDTVARLREFKALSFPIHSLLCAHKKGLSSEPPALSTRSATSGMPPLNMDSCPLVMVFYHSNKNTWGKMIKG